jgi:phosphopantetheinyl transferase (holo-ACP synthase)
VTPEPEASAYGSWDTASSRKTFRVVRQVTTPGKARHLDTLASAVAAFEAARHALEEAVMEALDHGASWSEIGALLGVSRQAAFQRFGPKNARQAQVEKGER